MKEIFEEEFDLVANDGLILKGNFWLAESKSKAVFCLVHGIGEHCRRYSSLVNFMLQKGIAVFSYDQRGHGKSEGKKGHIPSYSLLLDDVENILKKARSEYPDLPLILYGHSWGGNIVANYLLKRNSKEISAAILSAPWFKLCRAPAPLYVFLAFIANKFFPYSKQKKIFLPSALSKDPKVIHDFINDPLVHPYISARNFLESREAGLWALRAEKRISTPTLIIHGKKDEFTSWEASKEFADKHPENTEFKLWEEAKHEPHNDIEKDEVISHLFQWVKLNITSNFKAEKV